LFGEDKEDARWIARLTEMGMLRSSFVPPPEIRALRVCTRHIWDLTADRARFWQRLEKLLLRHEALLLPDGGERPSISPAVVAAG
jgi:Transposase